MEKTIALRNTDITFSIWDLGGQQEYLHMLPLVCNDAVALLFMFDLSRKSTLTSVKNWYKQARLLNKVRLRPGTGKGRRLPTAPIKQRWHCLTLAARVFPLLSLSRLRLPS